MKDSGVPVSLRDVSENTVRKSDEEITEEGKKEKETFEEKSTLLSQYVKKKMFPMGRKTAKTAINCL